MNEREKPNPASASFNETAPIDRTADDHTVRTIQALRENARAKVAAARPAAAAAAAAPKRHATTEPLAAVEPRDAPPPHEATPGAHLELKPDFSATAAPNPALVALPAVPFRPGQAEPRLVQPRAAAPSPVPPPPEPPPAFAPFACGHAASGALPNAAPARESLRAVGPAPTIVDDPQAGRGTLLVNACVRRMFAARDS